MIASTQIRNTDIFAFIDVLVFKAIEPQSFVDKKQRQIETVKK